MSNTDKKTDSYEVNPLDVEEVIDWISTKTGNDVIIKESQRSAIEEMLRIGKKSDVLAAFNEFYRDRSASFGYQMRFAAREFAEEGPQRVRTYVLERERAGRTKEQVEQIKSSVAAAALAEQAEMLVDERSPEEVLKDLGFEASEVRKPHQTMFAGARIG